VALLVRSWNLFHGNTQPPGRRAYVEEMVRLASADRPDVLCLQEVPAWALSRLAAWSGLAARTTRTMRPLLGVELGRRLTALNPGLLRSAFDGQGNAILLAAELEILEELELRLNPLPVVWEEGRKLGLGLGRRVAWARERRVCQALRVRADDGKIFVIANLHATSSPGDARLPDVEVVRAAELAVGMAAGDEPVIVGGDLNVRPGRSTALARLAAMGFSAPGPGIDLVIVRGAAVRAVTVWPDERRRLDGQLLSDHAPVEVTVE
jgi:endonuclease/exonuclease/phosphatase family metal-dependent hydrolase